MKTVFADTFYWVALTNPSDGRYGDVLAYDDWLSDTTIITTDEALTEFLTFFSSDAWLRNRAVETVRELLSDSTVRVIPQSHESFLSGFDLYWTRPDKSYSLTDCISCISMQVMRREGIVNALTNDRHFEQEGFRPLFRSG